MVSHSIAIGDAPNNRKQVLIGFTKYHLDFISRIFQRKISANRLALVGMAGGRVASTIRLKFCFLTKTQMFLNGID